jgi:hypothetical protein
MISIQSAIESNNIPVLLEYLSDYAESNRIYYKGNLVNPKNSVCFRGIQQFLEEHNVYTKQLAKEMSDFAHKNLEDIEQICPKFSKTYKKAIQRKRKIKKQKDKVVENNLITYFEENPSENYVKKESVDSIDSEVEKILKLAAKLNAKTFKFGDCEVTF